MQGNRGSAERQEALREKLFELIVNVIAKSSDRSCYMAESTMARRLKCRNEYVHRAKWELVNEGKLRLEERSNGKRKNPKHRLTLPIGNSIHSILEVGDRGLRNCSTCQARPFVGFDLWNDLPRLDLIDCYLKSGWNVCPLAKLKKTPIFTRDRWSQWKREQKIDFFYTHPDFGVGMWLDHSLTVFDFDSDREVPCTTLISKRGDHSHAFFEGHPEIYNSTRINLEGDIDTRARGGLVALPPTVHESGMKYQWANLVAPAQVPETLLQIWRSRQAAKPTGFRLRQLPDLIRQGIRNDTLWAYGRHLKATGATYDLIAVELIIVNRSRCRPPLQDCEVDRLIEHVWTHPNRPHWM
jgi:hypothetical protein